MNINIYLEDELAKTLNQSVKRTGQSRNAVIREAIREYLIIHEEKKWPATILSFKGSKHFRPFETHRNDLTPPKDDPLK